MTDNNSRYNNRNLWRKIVGYGPQSRPQITQIVDQSTNVTYSLDLQTTFRHRDYFEIKPGVVLFQEEAGPIVYSYGEYDEGLIYFNSITSFSSSVNFNFVFSNNPIVVFTMEQGYNNLQNVNFFGISYNSASLIINTSAPFSGTIRYRAIYAPTYPTIVTSSDPASSSYYLTASAGVVNAVGDSYSATFGPLPAIPAEFYNSTWEAGNNASDVALYSPDYLTNWTVAAQTSAPYLNYVHFLAIII